MKKKKNTPCCALQKPSICNPNLDKAKHVGENGKNSDGNFFYVMLSWFFYKHSKTKYLISAWKPEKGSFFGLS